MLSIIERYEKEWITSASPDFMETLKKQGQLDLQNQETGALQAFHAAYASYAGKREKLFSGESRDYARASVGPILSSAAKNSSHSASLTMRGGSSRNVFGWYEVPTSTPSA